MRFGPLTSVNARLVSDRDAFMLPRHVASDLFVRLRPICRNDFVLTGRDLTKLVLVRGERGHQLPNCGVL